MLTKNIQVDFLAVKKSNFRKKFYQSIPQALKFQNRLGPKIFVICEKKIDDPLHVCLEMIPFFKLYTRLTEDYRYTILQAEGFSVE